MGGFFKGEQAPGLIDWTTLPTYNTIMAVAAGAALVALVLFVRGLAHLSSGVSAENHQVPAREELATESARASHRASGIAHGELKAHIDGYAIVFGVCGSILFLTGLHMILTWPLAAGFPFDNIVFGETCLPLGALLLGLSLYLWRRGDDVLAAENPLAHLARIASPVGFFAVLLGLALIGIGFAGLVYSLFQAPPQEPISGAFAQWPLLENAFLAILFWLIAFAAITYPFVMKQIRTTGALGGLAKAAGWALLVSGAVWGLFGAMNFYTHIGLIVNTM